MKAIILISSIFYILGLKIGDKIDLTTGTIEVKEITAPEVTPKKSETTIEYKEEINNQTQTDSLKNNSSEKELLDNSK